MLNQSHSSALIQVAFLEGYLFLFFITTGLAIKAYTWFLTIVQSLVYEHHKKVTVKIERRVDHMLRRNLTAATDHDITLHPSGHVIHNRRCWCHTDNAQTLRSRHLSSVR